MPNMSYCRFTNTRTDLDDCLQSLLRDDKLSDFEVRAGKNMFKEFLTFCRDADIIDSFDSERINDLFDAQREQEDEDE